MTNADGGLRFEVQARIVQRRNGIRVRDDVRLAMSHTLDDATRTARTLAADGYTVWVFHVERAVGGTTPSYRLVERLDQVTRPPHPQTEPAANPGVQRP